MHLHTDRGNTLEEDHSFPLIMDYKDGWADWVDSEGPGNTIELSRCRKETDYRDR